MSEQVVSIGEVVNIGRDLKSELERMARQDFNADVTWLARKILREWIAEHASE